MPFVQRAVGPVHLSRVKLHDEHGVPTVRDRELDAVTNFALSNALRQMASVAALADEVFRELRGQLADVATRSAGLKRRVQALGHLVDHADPKAVTVPESDLTAFSLKTEHFKSKQVESKNLLLAENRPIWVKRLYDQAGVPSKVYANKPHVHRLSRRKRSLDDILLPDDIELRKPAAITNLRPWTSEEVLGDITVAPDCSSRIPRDPSPVSEDQIDHKLPSPEEQQQVIAHKFPPQIVEVDVSGRSFNRMSALRRSLQNVEYETSVRRRKSRRPRGKRRNTIAGTDQKELEAVIGSLSDSNKDSDDIVSSSTTVVVTEKRSNLDLLKDWGRMRFKQLKNTEPASSAAVKLRDKGRVGLARRKWDKEEPVHSSSGNWSASSESGQSTSTSHIPRSSVSSCSGSTKPTYHGGSSVTSDEGETGSTYSCDTEGYYTSFHVDSGLKTLREEDPPQPMSALHSTSALTPSFQSSSAESEYDVFGRGSTSTTASSAGTVCTSLMVSPPNVPERGGSKLSERSADISYGGSLPDRNNAHGPKDSSMALYDKSKTAPSRLTKENVTRYKEEGLMIDVKPRPCLEHGGGDSPDSGHNTCSSPVDSVTNPSVDLEMSECSDLEGVDRVERLRVKTTINTSRIPSMCVITPPMSDDEVSLKTCTAAMRAIVPDMDDYGEYVTLAHYAIPEPVKAIVDPPELATCKGFVHLDELPAVGTSERQKPAGARVTLNAEGRVIYTSDSLKRRKKTHTTNTFEPGPCVNANVRLLPVNDHCNSVLSQVIPRSPLNVRPVTKQPNGVGVLSSGLHIVAAKPKLQAERNTPAAVQLKPLVPIPLPCSPGQRRSCKTTGALPLTVATALGRNRAAPSRVVVLPDGGRCPADAAGKPVSPLISPTRRSLSPKEVVRGAYVRMQDPTECLETSLDEIKSVVKRSDSYRQANATSPRLQHTKSPNMLIALQKARSETTQDTSRGTPLASTSVNGDNSDRERNVSASTPVKNDRSAGRIDMSSNNISPIRDCRPSPTGRPQTNNTQQHRTPAIKSPPGDGQRTPAVQQPYVRPASGRSAMDLYAAIHESKKRLLGQQPVATQAITTAVQATQLRTQPQAPAVVRRQPERQSDRYRPRGDDRSAARYDFKRLLLQTNMAGGRRAQQSAVVRLQQPPPPPRAGPAPVPQLLSTSAGHFRRTPSGSSFRKSNVLTSTIQEDCREDEDCHGTSVVPRSAALVSRTLKGLQATAAPTCSALETSL
ncbi:uncharacterized protein LOC100163301 [Acyrthosiphon pisum]|uniref:Wiskott-Aldrich syndrome protein family member n=1 Tax=Acyrthosiphon pisum TaxID=7029 RepID=A0A8R2A5A0_ACYPI|nr:uncharacterized protein LOC100163301 [Acyrthosiphon pisum]|eukprot:XP_001944548.2 PREDICTED: uncharacterized protein LOC100163301 [Acyrthosiphon pisum]